MGDPIEKTSLVSSGYQSFANEELGMSIAPADQVGYYTDQNTSSLSSDSFESTLTLDTKVPVRDGSQVRQMPIRGLLEEAGRGRTWALDALDSFLEERLSAYESNNQMCYLSCEDNIGPILTQLRSQDSVERREAARSLLGIILGQAPDALTSSDDLRRGLLVAAQKISNINQDHIFYEELAALDPQSRQQIRQLVQQGQIPSDPQLMQATRVRQGESPDQSPATAASDAPVARGGGSLSPSGTDSSQAAEVSLAHQPTNRSLAAKTTYEGIIQSSLDKALSDGSVAESFLSGPARSGVATRLHEILQTPGLSTSHISQTLAYAILGRAWSDPDFSSVENHYAELRPAARQVATDILNRLGFGRSENTAVNTGAHLGIPQTGTAISGATLPRRGLARADSTLLGSPQIKGLSFGGIDGVSSAVGAPLPTSSSVAAGMMGVNFFALAGRPVWQSMGFSGNDRPEYYVEGATASEGEGHHGSDSQSGDQQDSSRQESAGGGENIFVA